MNDLKRLADELQRELGQPPDAWQDAQRARWRQGQRAGERHARLRSFAPWVAVALAVVAVLFLIPALRRGATSDERWLVAEDLHGPVRLDDGSSIALEPGGRGRLFADTATVRFDLHQGRASFDVVPERKRTWTIVAGKNEVRVVGTRFSVFFGAGEAFEVEVERGIVAVQVPDRNASIELRAGDHLQGRPGQLAVTHGTSSNAPPAPASAPPSGSGVAQVPASPEAPALETSPPTSAPSVPGAAPEPDWQVRYAQGKYAESLALIRAHGVSKHLSELSASALAELADVARLGGDPELAVNALTVLLQRFPSAPEARDGKFLLGRVQVLRGDDRAAVDAFESYLRRPTSGRYVNETRGRLMELYSKRGDTDRARAVAEQYLAATPNGPYARLARSLVSPER
jgi:TolA-binding protein